MSGNAEVDVIILSWNRVRETIAAIESARAQEGLVIAIYVVDQGSTPENLQLIKSKIQSYPNVHLIALSENRGVPGGRNIATQAGTAPVVVAIDNDAVFATPDTLRRAVEVLRKEPELGAIGFRILNYNTGLDDATSWGYPEREWERRHLEFPCTNFVGAGHAIRRKAFEEVAGYEERLFFAGEELELGLKMLNMGYRIRYIGSIAIRHKVAKEARVRWGDGRFYYTVRNRVYLSLKSGAPISRVLETAGGFVIKGLRYGFPLSALRGLVAALSMYLSLRKDTPEARLSRLTPDVMAYVDRLNYRDSYSFWDRLRNAWRRKSEIAPLASAIIAMVSVMVLFLQDWSRI